MKGGADIASDEIQFGKRTYKKEVYQMEEANRSYQNHKTVLENTKTDLKFHNSRFLRKQSRVGVLTNYD